MFGTNLQTPRMMPMTRPMAGAPNNIQPGVRPIATPMMPRQMGGPPPMRTQMMVNSLRGTM